MMLSSFSLNHWVFVFWAYFICAVVLLALVIYPIVARKQLGQKIQRFYLRKDLLSRSEED